MKLAPLLATVAPLCALLPLAPASAQCPSWDPGFHQAGLVDVVRAQAVYDDGQGPKLYVGGTLRQAGGQEVRGLARKNGTSWETIGDVELGGLAGEIYALAVFDDGSGAKLFAGGRFDSIGGGSANHIARWDGTTWKRLGLGTDGPVRSLAVYDDGSGPALYVGGQFTQAGGQPASGIARWLPGSWSALGVGLLGFAYDLEVFDPGTGPRLYATGSFTWAGGAPADAIASWDGANWSALGDGLLHQDGRALAVWDDGNGPDLYVVGGFTQFGGGFSARGIARWDGSAWSTLGTGLTFGGVGVAFGEALAVAEVGGVQSLYVGGGFDTAGGIPAVNVARWTGQAFEPLGSGVKGAVRSLVAFDDGGGSALYVGGDIDGPTAQEYVLGLGRWDGNAWSAVAEGSGLAHSQADPWIGCFALYDGGAGPEFYAGGRFQGAGPTTAAGIARWDGSGWSKVGDGTHWADPSGVASVLALEVWDAGFGPELYAGGWFPSIARWDGASWHEIPDAPSDQIRALAVYDDGSGPALYVGGTFLAAGAGVAGTRGIARWDGSAWSSVAGGLGFSSSGSYVNALAVHDDGSGPALYAAGVFGSVGGVAANRIARWNGASWSPVGGGLGASEPYALIVHEGELYVSGSFTQIGGVPTDRIARWNGASWNALAPAPFESPTVEVRGLASLDLGDGGGPRLLALGSSVGTTASAPGLAAWDGTSWSPVAGPIEHATAGLVRAAALFDDGSSAGPSLFVGGIFSSAGGVPSVGIARLATCDLPGVSFCAGDGVACPCANAGLAGHGCENSASSGGAVLAASGGALLAQDGLVLGSSGELPSALSIFLQGSLVIAPVSFGDGLRCAGGDLKRLYVRNASGGAVSAPQPGESSVSARSAELGAPLTPGATRVYQVYYRDPDAGFCPPPAGASWNVTNAMRIVWR
jgi:hypothetical protein